MKLIVSIIISAALIYFTQSYLATWWLFAIVTFIMAIALPLKSGWRHFFAGLIPVAGVWMLLYLMQDPHNESLLSNKVAALFSLPNNMVLFIVASLVAGLIGGLAAVAGGALRKKK